MRYWLAYLIAPALVLTGYRFDKSWRHAERGPKALVYRLCCTFAANHIADTVSPYLSR